MGLGKMQAVIYIYFPDIGFQWKGCRSCRFP